MIIFQALPCESQEREKDSGSRWPQQAFTVGEPLPEPGPLCLASSCPGQDGLHPAHPLGLETGGLHLVLERGLANQPVVRRPLTPSPAHTHLLSSTLPTSSHL